MGASAFDEKNRTLAMSEETKELPERRPPPRSASKQAEIAFLRQQLSFIENHGRKLEAERAELQAENRMLRQDLILRGKEAQLSLSQITRLESEIERLRQVNSMYQEEFAKSLRHFQNRSSRTDRESELLAELHSERTKQSELRKVFQAKFESLRTTHPLKDYLSFTERELARVEAALGARPIPPQAQALQTAKTQLLQQRDLLQRALLEADERLARELRALG